MSVALVRGIEMAYADVGSGPTVVLLHGYPLMRFNPEGILSFVH